MSAKRAFVSLAAILCIAAPALSQNRATKPLTIYVVDWTIEKMPALLEGMAKATAELGLAPAPVTLIGVAALFEPDVLVEIEATAVADR